MSDKLDEALTVPQRIKRGQMMRKNRTKLKRARKLAQKRLANDQKIKKRASRQARMIIRKRFAGKQGEDYANLSPSQKMAIDKAIEKKQAAIEKIAKRLIPKVKKAEYQRLQSYLKGTALKHQTETKSVNESLDSIFEKKFNNIIILNRLDDKTQQALKKKAEKSGINEVLLAQVYQRGLKSWTEETNVTPEQFAFARVNSYISKGRTFFNEDADLSEVKNFKIDVVHASPTGKLQTRRISVKARSAGQAKQAAKNHLKDTYNSKIKRVMVAEEIDFEEYAKNHRATMAKHGGTYYHLTHKQGDSNASNGYVTGHDPDKPGHVMFSHNVSSGVRSENDDKYETISVPEKHLTKDYNKSWSAKSVKEDCEDFKIVDRANAPKRGHKNLNHFRHEQIKKKIVDEDVKSAEKAPVVVPAHNDQYGNSIPAMTVMRKKGRKILKTGNVHDGN